MRNSKLENDLMDLIKDPRQLEFDFGEYVYGDDESNERFLKGAEQLAFVFDSDSK